MQYKKYRDEINSSGLPFKLEIIFYYKDWKHWKTTLTSLNQMLEHSSHSTFLIIVFNYTFCWNPCNDLWWKIIEKKKEKEEHADLMWFGQLPTSIGIGKTIFTIYQIRVT